MDFGRREHEGDEAQLKMSPLRMNGKVPVFILAAILFLFLGPAHLMAAAPAGYSEYYIPGDEDSMMRIFELTGGNDQDLGGTDGVDFCAPGQMHSEITVTSYGANGDNEPYIPLIYNLIGDPALLLH